MAFNALDSAMRPVPSAFGHVGHVLCVSARLQMIRIHARRVIAAVADLAPGRERTENVLVHHSVRPGVLITKPYGVEDAVASIVALAVPFPAASSGDRPADLAQSHV